MGYLVLFTLIISASLDHVIGRPGLYVNNKDYSKLVGTAEAGKHAQVSRSSHPSEHNPFESRPVSEPTNNFVFQPQDNRVLPPGSHENLVIATQPENNYLVNPEVSNDGSNFVVKSPDNDFVIPPEKSINTKDLVIPAEKSPNTVISPAPNNLAIIPDKDLGSKQNQNEANLVVPTESSRFGAEPTTDRSFAVTDGSKLLFPTEQSKFVLDKSEAPVQTLIQAPQQDIPAPEQLKIAESIPAPVATQPITADHAPAPTIVESVPTNPEPIKSQTESIQLQPSTGAPVVNVQSKPEPTVQVVPNSLAVPTPSAQVPTGNTLSHPTTASAQNTIGNIDQAKTPTPASIQVAPIGNIPVQTGTVKPKSNKRRGPKGHRRVRPSHHKKAKDDDDDDDDDDAIFNF